MMSELILEIKPKEGLGIIKFGEIPENVTKIIGAPGSAEDIPSDDDLKTTILSFDIGVTVFLEGLVEPIVSHFDCDNKEATLFGEKVFEMTEDAIEKLMKDNGFSEIEKEDEEWGEVRLTFEDAMMDFYFIDKKLTAVNWGVFINEDGSKQ